ncbi:MAG: histidine kinase, partial [Actinomadura rubrobrunea]|nr:histidine kinase [Actinomadura rubrobrunea]
ASSAPSYSDPLTDPLTGPLTGPLPRVGASSAPPPEPPRQEPQQRPETRADEQSESQPRRRAKGGRPALPKRVRQASLAPQLRGEQQPPEPPAAQERVRPERSPEEARAMMSAIQRGTRRGRAETAGPGEES